MLIFALFLTLMTCTGHVLSFESFKDLRLIAVAVSAHVLSVESKAKINIGVNGIHVVSVESLESFNSSEVNRCSGHCSCRECRKFQ